MEPIAIVGMGMRLPGGIRNESQYWSLLVNGHSGRCRVPKDRYNVDTWYGPDRAAHVGTQYGFFLDDVNLAHLDSSFWSMSKQEARSMDPRQRLLLEVVHEAFESAGATKWRGKEIGVYVGVMGDDWADMKRMDWQDTEPSRADVYGDYVIANRVSYEFDLKGPSLVVRTACSSSLTALHMACQDLRSRVCESAVVGGANLILSHTDTIAMTEQGVLSPNGECKTFDADADGYARGEGVSAIYIKLLSDALRDGDPVRAVIRATCISGDGRTNGMTAPDPESHERLIRKTYQLAGIGDISQTAMVECHGTGTPVGDPLEVGAVANIWGEKGVYIGSVKPNIGHGEGASGLSSLMKAVLALQNGTIPPNINFTTPNPSIPWDQARIRVPLKPLPWPSNRLERISVNSFGIGGSNAHVILESAALSRGIAHRPSPPLSPADDCGPFLLVFSAKHVESLKRSAKNIQDYLERHPQRLPDVAHTLALGREAYPCRSFAIADHTALFNASPASRTGNKVVTPVVWVFTGQGAQWAQMGKEILQEHPLVSRRIDELDAILATLPAPPTWTIRAEILKDRETSRLYEAEFSQPCLAAIQISLVDLLTSWGVTPSAVVGHSSGETAAAYASGAITAEEAIIIAYHRGQITPRLKQSHNGGMCAVGLGRKEVEPYLQPGVIVGCENSSSSVTLSGELPVLRDVMATIGSAFPDALVRALRVECGYHSAHMQTVAPEYASRLSGLPKDRKACIPFYSSVTGLPQEDLSPAYWTENLVSPVLFGPAVHRLVQDFPSCIFVELGPHSALAGPIRQVLQDSKLDARNQYIPTLVRNTNSIVSTLSTAGQLWALGVQVKLEAVNRPGKLQTDLPTYSWQYENEFWAESRISRQQRLRHFDHHELLGSRVVESPDTAPMWRCILRLEDVPWIREHSVLGEALFPATGYIAMAGEGIKQLTGSTSYSVEAVRFLNALTLSEDWVEVITAFNRQPTEMATEPHRYVFTISSLHNDLWLEHVAGICSPAPTETASDIPDFGLLPRKVSMASYNNLWRNNGLNYGPRFRGLGDVYSHVEKLQAKGTVHNKNSEESSCFYSVHPAVLDAALQLCMVASSQGLCRKFDGLEVPSFIANATIRDCEGPMQVFAQIQQHIDPTEKDCTLRGFNGNSQCVAVSGLRVNPFGRQPHPGEENHAGAVLEWKPDVFFLLDNHLEIDPFLGIGEAVQLIGHKNPSMRVLEFNSIPEASSSTTLEALQLQGGGRLYSSFIFVEPSAGFHSDALYSTLRHSPAVEISVLDPSKELDSQGFLNESFDLVIIPLKSADNSSIDLTTELAVKLARSSGILLFYHLDRTFSTDIKQPRLRLLRVTDLKENNGVHKNLNNGFPIRDIHEDTLEIGAVTPCSHQKQKISVICRDPNHGPIAELLAILRKSGFEVEDYAVGQDLPRGQTALCLLDLDPESPFLIHMGGLQFASLKHTIYSLEDAGLLWVTGASQLNCKNPNYSLTLGFARTARREVGIDLVTLELDSFDEPAWAATMKILASFPERKNLSAASPDWEYVLSGGSVQISRLYPMRLLDELQDSRRTAALGSAASLRTSMFRSDRTYVLVGGLGGIGMACARFMVEHGARHIVFFSRSAGTFLVNNPDYSAELEAMGCQIHASSGHVDNVEDVERALWYTAHPIGGIIHAAMVLQDNNLTDMTFDQWQAVISPKVSGAWNIHNALSGRSEHLDFFLLLSSLSGLGGQVGQANYAAANSFLDAFSQYRRGQGLPCSVLDIGLVEDIGVLARETHRLRAFESTKTHRLRERDVLDAIALMTSRDYATPADPCDGSPRKPGQVALGLRFDVSAEPVGINATGWRKDPRTQLFWNQVSTPTHSNSGPESIGLKQFLQECKSNPEILISEGVGVLLAEEVKRAFVELMIQVEGADIDAPLDTVGVDSLVSVELRNWIKQKMGVNLKVPEIIKADSIKGIGELLAKRLRDMYETSG